MNQTTNFKVLALVAVAALAMTVVAAGFAQQEAHAIGSVTQQNSFTNTGLGVGINAIICGIGVAGVGTC